MPRFQVPRRVPEVYGEEDHKTQHTLHQENPSYGEMCCGGAGGERTQHTIPHSLPGIGARPSAVRGTGAGTLLVVSCSTCNRSAAQRQQHMHL
eukprot:jgi/Chrzof1/8611/Cz03g17100.t1